MRLSQSAAPSSRLPEAHKSSAAKHSPAMYQVLCLVPKTVRRKRLPEMYLQRPRHSKFQVLISTPFPCSEANLTLNLSPDTLTALQKEPRLSGRLWLLASSLGVTTEAEEGSTKHGISQWSQVSQPTGISQSPLEWKHRIALCVHVCLTVQACVCTYMQRSRVDPGWHFSGFHSPSETVSHRPGTYRVD